MPAVTTPADVKQLGTILTVWAHPDDESFSCGGIIAAAIANGQRVVCVTATKGEAGVQDPDRWPPEQLAEIRATEMKAAMQALGITEHHWLDYADGGCHLIPDEEGAARIREFIDQVQPNSILTFGPDGITGHTDHQAVSRWATAAAKGTPVTVYYAVEDEDTYEKYMKPAHEMFNIYFNIDKPPVCDKNTCDIAFELDKALMQKKCAALKAMPSQTEGMFTSMPQEFFDNGLSCECFNKAD